jgi:hypothetical protein
VSDLATTQRWLQDVITDPDGVEAGVARASGCAAPLAADAVVHGSENLSATERLALYGRTYRRRLVGCLRDSYPALCHALGGELFEDFALDYLRTKPARSYTLASLGRGWPAHLEATRPDRDGPETERESWPDFIVDLARLERTFCEVFDGPGVEGETIATGTDVPVDARWSSATVAPVRCLRLLAVRFAVGDYLVAVRRGEDPPLPAPHPCSLAVSRRDYVVTITTLDATAHALLAALGEGSPLGAAARRSGVTPDQARGMVRAWADRAFVAEIAARRPHRPVVQSTRGAGR